MTRRPDLSWLGRCCRVTVDRPLGSRHPRLPDVFYPVNYGFIEGTLVGDGCEIDADILDVGEPVASYCGLCVAVIDRRNEDEDKLVFADRPVTEDVIRAQTEFMERHFDIEIAVLPGSGAISILEFIQKGSATASFLR